MRVLAKISLPVESGNRGIAEGTIPRVIQRTAERWHPEAMYFTTFEGRRTAFVVFDLPEPQDLPPFAEPWFTEINAEVSVSPVMDGADLQKGLSHLS